MANPPAYGTTVPPEPEEIPAIWLCKLLTSSWSFCVSSSSETPLTVVVITCCTVRCVTGYVFSSTIVDVPAGAEIGDWEGNVCGNVFCATSLSPPNQLSVMSEKTFPKFSSPVNDGGTAKKGDCICAMLAASAFAPRV